MSETTMPVAEVAAVGTDKDTNSYELAFHVLPTVAEGEVSNVFTAIKAHIQHVGAAMTTEEAPERVDLAYEVVKHLEGKNRKFKSAYFGWIRFEATSAAVAEIVAMVDTQSTILRHLLIKLTREEAAKPFFYHVAMKEAGTVVSNFSDDEVESTTEGEAEVVDADAEVTDTETAEAADKENA